LIAPKHDIAMSFWTVFALGSPKRNQTVAKTTHWFDNHGDTFREAEFHHLNREGRNNGVVQ
jgi:hypothetical protein